MSLPPPTWALHNTNEGLLWSLTGVAMTAGVGLWGCLWWLAICSVHIFGALSQVKAMVLLFWVWGSLPDKMYPKGLGYIGFFWGGGIRCACIVGEVGRHCVTCVWCDVCVLRRWVRCH